MLVSQAPGRDGQVGGRRLAAEARGQAEEAAVQGDRGPAMGSQGLQSWVLGHHCSKPRGHLLCRQPRDETRPAAGSPADERPPSPLDAPGHAVEKREGLFCAWFNLSVLFSFKDKEVLMTGSQADRPRVRLLHFSTTRPMDYLPHAERAEKNWNGQEFSHPKLRFQCWSVRYRTQQRACIEPFCIVNE